MDTVQVLTNLVENHQIWAYLIIFFGLIFEGEIIVIMAGVLSYLGALNFWISLAFIIFGGLVKTFSCYYLGTLLYKRYYNNKVFQYIERRVFYFMPRFKEKPFWSIFISKFIMGVNYLIIIFSGYHKISLKIFLKAEIISTVIWAPALLSLGFFFSQTAISVSREIGKFSLVVFVLVVIFLLFDKIISSFYTFYEYFKNEINGNGRKQ